MQLVLNNVLDYYTSRGVADTSRKNLGEEYGDSGIEGEGGEGGQGRHKLEQLYVYKSIYLYIDALGHEGFILFFLLQILNLCLGTFLLEP